MTSTPGTVVVLNGPPRVGKSSIATAIRQVDARRWVDLGVDAMMAATPQHLQPGIGLRPGGERPDLEPFVRRCYAALFETIGGLSRRGVNVVTDVGIHDDYAQPLHVLADAARRLDGCPAFLIGVHCSDEETRARRAFVRENYAVDPGIIELWRSAVHDPGIYDADVDTTYEAARVCAELVLARVRRGAPSALRRIREQR